MGCHHDLESTSNNPQYRHVLWAVLGINGAMFLVEIIGGFMSGSTSLLSDSMDFLGDAANYAISLFVLNKALRTRAAASLLKAYSMGVFGVVVLTVVGYRFFFGDIPDSAQMSLIGILALFANVLCAFLLYRYRNGDSNMLSVWLCSRNDAIGNMLVVLAAICVYYTHSNIPDLLVAMVMAYLAIKAAVTIIQQANQERAATDDHI